MNATTKTSRVALASSYVANVTECERRGIFGEERAQWVRALTNLMGAKAAKTMLASANCGTEARVNL